MDIIMPIADLKEADYNDIKAELNASVHKLNDLYQQRIINERLNLDQLNKTYDECVCNDIDKMSDESDGTDRTERIKEILKEQFEYNTNVMIEIKQIDTVCDRIRVLQQLLDTKKEQMKE
jgi:hypothetical protein